jgi:t-SNARE complex subunit (syntaxin)
MSVSADQRLGQTRSLNDIFNDRKKQKKNNQIQLEEFSDDQNEFDNQIPVKDADESSNLITAQKSVSIDEKNQEWQNILSEIKNTAIPEITKSVLELRFLHKSYFTPTFDQDEDEIHGLINAKVSEIENKIVRAYKILEKIKSEKTVGSQARTFAKIKNGMIIGIASELTTVVNTFKKEQQYYLKQKMHTESLMPPALEKIIVTEIQQPDEYNMRPMELTSNQITELDQMKNNVSSRQKEIIEIVKGVNEINKLFIEISTLTYEQGLSIDNIEMNVEGAERNVEEGTQEIIKASEIQKKSRSNTCWAIVCILLFIVVLTVTIIVSTSLV